ncbi:MAG TPA: hypothetical protein VG755_29690 [Nannocystaceae bacterium]|nr:hypothetical protein [Nannocystaceae bacterium]
MRTCGGAEIPTAKPDGSPIKAANLNDQLAKDGAYSLADRDQQSANLRIRNEAAHADAVFESRALAEIRIMLTTIRQFIGSHPA